MVTVMRAHGVAGVAVGVDMADMADMVDMAVMAADGAMGVGATVGTHISINYELQFLTSTLFISGYPYWGLNGGYGGYWG